MNLLYCHSCKRQSRNEIMKCGLCPSVNVSIRRNKYEKKPIEEIKIDRSKRCKHCKEQITDSQPYIKIVFCDKSTAFPFAETIKTINSYHKNCYPLMG